MSALRTSLSEALRDDEHVGEQLLHWAHGLADHTDQPGELTCLYLSPAHRRVAAQLATWMRRCGFDEVREDAAGNVIGCYHADSSVSRPRLVCTGSHYDTVRNAGMYDGRLGILVSMAVVARLCTADIRLAFDLHVVAFADEESARFGGAFLGSSAYAGRWDPAMFERCDADGISLRQALLANGLDPEALMWPSTDLKALSHYFEVHIEQGPTLLERGLPLGVVSAISGSVGYVLTVTGEAGHAGAMPMALRRDALCAAAEIALLVERRCQLPIGLVGTVGMLDIPGGSVNVVPGECRLTLNVRAPDDETRDAALADILAGADEICHRRGMVLSREQTRLSAATSCDPRARAGWAAAIQTVGGEVFELPSGAGHDAVLMAAVTPVSMLFVRCGNGGISHNPRETVTSDDVTLAVRATERFLRNLSV